MPKKKARTHRPSKLDKLTASVLQDHKDLDTRDIVRRRSVAVAALDAVESEIADGIAKLADARGRRSRIEATLTGLGMAIGQRR